MGAEFALLLWFSCENVCFECYLTSVIKRQGDKIYQLSCENVTMIKKGPVMTKSSNTEMDLQLEEIVSGESLYKTFRFDNVISTEEVEKCLTFWRSVVEKNLEPIKCTLIEKATNDKAEIDEKNNKRHSEKKQRLKTKKSSKEAVQKDRDTNVLRTKRNTWYEIMSELQKKRLNQTRLLMEKRCRFCGYVSSPSYETEDSKIQDDNFIKEIDKWGPASYRKKGSVSSKKSVRSSFGSGRRGSQFSQNRPTNLLGPLARIVDKHIEETQDEKDDAEKLKEIKKESSKIKYIDAIQKKKDLGDYTRWRKNEMEPCVCNLPDCDCNINPAIKAVIATSVLPKATDRKDNKDTVSSLKENEILEEREHDIQDTENTELNTENVHVENLGESEDIETSIEAAPTPNNMEIARNPEKENHYLQECSHDLIEVKLTVHSDTSMNKPPDSEQLIQNETINKDSDGSVEDINLAIVAKPASIEADSEVIIPSSMSYSGRSKDATSTSRPKRSILIIRDDGKSEMRKRDRKRSNQKSLSVVLACVCSNETCDCKELITLPEKVPIPEGEASLPKPSKISANRSVHKVNSLELIKKRLSSISVPPDLEKGKRNKNERVSKVQYEKGTRSSVRSVDSLELARRRLTRSSTMLLSESDEEIQNNANNRIRTVSIYI